MSQLKKAKASDRIAVSINHHIPASGVHTEVLSSIVSGLLAVDTLMQGVPLRMSAYYCRHD